MMESPGFASRSRLNERASIAVSYAIVSVMMTCAAVPVIQLGEWIIHGWSGGYLLLACFFVTLEALVSWRTASKWTMLSPEGLMYRAAEFIVVFIGLKAYIYSQHGFAQLWADIPRWAENINNFVDGEYLFAASLVVACWLAATWFAGALMGIESDEILIETAETRGALESNRGEARRGLIGSIFTVGGVMLALTALLRSNLSFLGIQSPVLQTGLANVVLYFVLGLVLLAQSRFAVLRAQWILDRIPVRGNMALRWAVYSALLLLFCAALVTLLPTRYSLGLIDTLAYLFELLLVIVNLLFFVLVAPIIFLIGALLRLLGQPAPVSLPAPPPAFTPPPPRPTPTESISWFEALKSILFWVVFLGVLGFSIYYYLRQRKDVVALLGKLPGWLWLVKGWLWLRGGARKVNANIVGAVRAGLSRLRPARLGQRFGYIGLSRLSPRDRVRFFYLAMVRRSGERGWPRRRAQTPFEYENDLASRLPDVDDDLAAITDAFVEARYSRHEITLPNANTARDHWENIKRALRNRRTPKTQESRQ